MARFAAAWLAKRDEAVLDLYPQLAPELADLPVPGALVWCAAATLWVRRKHWKPLLEDELPEVVADLSQPEARFLVSCAYAHAAADASRRNDTRGALQHLRRATNTIEPLLAPAN
jgi:hypothetical protein